MLLPMAVNADQQVQQLDVEAAFLNGDLHKEVFLTPPTGVKCPPQQVWRLRKDLFD
jgi:hypothetical protein